MLLNESVKKEVKHCVQVREDPRHQKWDEEDKKIMLRGCQHFKG